MLNGGERPAGVGEENLEDSLVAEKDLLVWRVS